MLPESVLMLYIMPVNLTHYTSGQHTDAVNLTHYTSGQCTDAVNLTHAVECTKQLRLVLSGTWCGECNNERSGLRHAEEGDQMRPERKLYWHDSLCHTRLY